MKRFVIFVLRILTKTILAKYKPDVIGITGSVGKTTTKDAVDLVLRHKKRVRSAENSMNSEIGVPLTVIGKENPCKSIVGWLRVFAKAIALLVKKDQQYPEVLVLEMAADKRGDIGYLCDMAHPRIGIVTAITPVHLHQFRSIEGVAKEKKKLLQSLPRTGVAILNGDDEIVSAMKKDTEARVVLYGLDHADVGAVDVSMRYKDGENFYERINGLGFKLLVKESVTPVVLPATVGYHHLYSVLAAVAVGLEYGMNPIEIADQLQQFKSGAGRLRLLRGIHNSVILDDSYNSSPSAVMRGLEALCDLKDPVAQSHRRIAVLGDMLELGGFSEEAHHQVGKKCAELRVDLLVTVGNAAKDIGLSAHDAGMGEDTIMYFETCAQAAEYLKQEIRILDIMLIKGSQGIRMERITKEVMADPDQAQELLPRQSDWWRKKP